MRAEELTAEFGIAGVLDFVEAEHGPVKAGISLDGVTEEIYLQRVRRGDGHVLGSRSSRHWCARPSVRGTITDRELHHEHNDRAEQGRNPAFLRRME